MAEVAVEDHGEIERMKIWLELEETKKKNLKLHKKLVCERKKKKLAVAVAILACFLAFVVLCFRG